jgi:predicted PurR-regulated permease PerM
MLILLFFILVSGDAFLNKLVRIAPSLDDKKRVVQAARDIQHQVSIYLGTITLINIVVGAVVAGLMHFFGVPNPILWGVMAGALNFIPYLGVAITIAVVAFVCLLTFDTIGQILLPPASIFLVNVVEGQFLTPIIAGRRLALSPVAIFLSLVVLGWIWGIIGVLIAVPVLATIKLVSEHVEPLMPLATLLGRD